MSTLDYIINQSFQEDINRYNNRHISTAEAQNVNELFAYLEGETNECNICYNDDKCLQCYQCEFKYCKDCMNKIISEFTKCSACQCDFINNYNLITQKNLELSRQKNKTISQNKPTTPHQEYNVAINDIDDDILAIAIQNSILEYTNSQTSNNSDMKANETLNDIRNYDINNDINNNINDNQSKVNYKTYEINEEHTTQNTQLNNYVEELHTNQVLSFKITSLKPTYYKPNFNCNYDTFNKLLIFSSHDNNLPNIELNYKCFNTIFQMELRIILISLLDYPHKFNNIWSRIASIIKNYKPNKPNKPNKSNICQNTGTRVDELDSEIEKILKEIKKLVNGN
jgi:hypothetical protein